MKMFREARREARRDLKLILSRIRIYNKHLRGMRGFDLASLRNIIHNAKITADLQDLGRFFRRYTNVESLRKILGVSRDEALEKIDKWIDGSDRLLAIEDPRILLREVRRFDVELRKEAYLLSDFAVVKASSLRKKNDAEIVEILHAHVINNKDALEAFRKKDFAIESEMAKAEKKLTSLIKQAYSPEKMPGWYETLKERHPALFRLVNKFIRLKPVIAPEKTRFRDLFRKENRSRLILKSYFFGTQERQGILSKIIIYALLIIFGFVYVYPILYMLGYSFMSTSDLVNPNVTYVPTHLEGQNYVDAMATLDYWKSLGETLLVSVFPAILQTISCSLVAWGLARYKMKAGKFILALIVFTFLVPSALTMLPTVSLYAKLGITGNVLAYLLPALFGQGIKSAVFILVFYQYFKALPKSIVEAAEIDGANDFVIYLRIALPSATSAILLSLLLSVVWYYNETVLASLFFGSSISTLPLGLENFKATFDRLVSSSGGGKTINEAIYMAGTMLNILPLLVLYFFTQKYFIQGVDKAGITGE